MPTKPQAAMMLAAGLGLRMRPLTNHVPKPLIKVGGKPIIDYALAHVRATGVKKLVVNKHHLAGQIEDWAHSVTDMEIETSDETEAVLDTGGGVLRALPMLGPQPFFVLNCDCFWTDSGTPALQRLQESFDESKMDCMVLLSSPSDTTGYDGAGDFALGDDGRLQRQHQNGLVYIGAYIVHPRLFDGTEPGRFSMNLLWDKAIAQGRLFGMQHEGHWLHIGTPSAIAKAEAYLRGA